MTSFALRVEPPPAPRLAAVAALLHLGATTCPWLLGVPAALAAVLTIAAFAGSLSTLACIPGRRHRLAALALDERGLRARVAGTPEFVPATLGPASRAFAGLVFLQIRAGGRRHAWLLARGSLAPADFRRLKARIRFSC